MSISQALAWRSKHCRVLHGVSNLSLPDVSCRCSLNPSLSPTLSFHSFPSIPLPLQVVKFNCQGETWVEKGPYCPPFQEEDLTENETVLKRDKEVQVAVPEAVLPVIVEAPSEPVTRKEVIRTWHSQEEPFRRRTGAILQASRKTSSPLLGRSVSVSYAAIPVPVSSLSCHLVCVFISSSLSLSI